MKSTMPLHDVELQRGLHRAVELISTGSPGAASRLLRDLALRRPDSFDILHVWGAAQVQDGRLNEGINLLKRAAELRPTAPAVWVNLAGAYEKAGRLADAAEAFTSALEAEPALVEASYRRTLVLLAMGQVENAQTEAVGFAQRYAINDAAHQAVGLVRMAQGRLEDAVASFRRAIDLNPGNTLARANLGFALGAAGRYAEVVPLLKDVVARQPGHWTALEKLIHARRIVCDWSGLARQEEALLKEVASGRPAVDPDALVYLTDRPELLKRAATSHAERLVPKLPAALRSAAPAAHGRIRLAYIASDVRGNVGVDAMADVLAAHDRSQFEVIGISLAAEDPGGPSGPADRPFDRMIDVHGLSPEMAARRIAGANVTIAVDLAGPTADGMAPVLALRPAHVQVGHLGFAGTSGAQWMDYIIADEHTAPTGEERAFTEQVVRLPDCFFPAARRPMAELPSRTSAGLPEQALILASFNGLRTVSASLFDVWMRLLAGAPDSVLWLGADDPTAIANLRTRAGERGIAPERLVMAPTPASEAEQRSRLAMADLILDTLPRTQPLGLADALWAGVPVLTVAGNSFASRMARSLVANAGLPELAVADMAAYEATAQAFARDPQRLRALKARLVASRDTCALFDVARYTRNLEAAFKLMVHQARQGLRPAGSITVAPQSA